MSARTVRWQPPSSIERNVQTIKDNGSLVGTLLSPPWKQVSAPMRSGEQTHTAITPWIQSSHSLITTEGSIAAAQSRVLAALREGQPYELLSSLLQALKDPGFLRSLPDTTILEILRSLDSEYFIQPYKLYMERNARIATYTAHVRGIPGPVAEYASLYIQFVQHVLAQRQNLGVAKYEILLNIARAVGDERLATETWENMLVRRHRPDVICYNYYFETLCWPNRRLLDSPLYTMESLYRPRVKKIVSRIFTNMIASGVMADVKTFGFLMTACSRAHDLESVKTILKKVWHVDVDAVLESDNRSSGLHDVPPDSPIQPTPDLLFTIAHIFGSNKSIGTGLRVVDHISRRFSVPIDETTWYELMMWTSFTNRQTRERNWITRDCEQVPDWSVEALWNVLTTTHKSGLRLRDFVSQVFYERSMPSAMLRVMISGLYLHNEFRSTLSQSLHNIRKPEHLVILEESQYIHTIRRWVLQFLKPRRWAGGPEHNILLRQRQQIPKVVNLFWRYEKPNWGWSFIMWAGKARLRSVDMLSMACRDWDLKEYLEMRIDSPPKYSIDSARAFTHDLDTGTARPRSGDMLSMACPGFGRKGVS